MIYRVQCQTTRTHLKQFPAELCRDINYLIVDEVSWAIKQMVSSMATCVGKQILSRRVMSSLREDVLSAQRKFIRFASSLITTK